MWNHKLTGRSTQAPHRSNRVTSRTLAPNRKQNHRTHQSSYRGRGEGEEEGEGEVTCMPTRSREDHQRSAEDRRRWWRGRPRRWKRIHRTGRGEEGEAPNEGGNPNAHPRARWDAPISRACASPSRQGAHRPRWRGKLASRRRPQPGRRGKENEKIHQNNTS